MLNVRGSRIVSSDNSNEPTRYAITKRAGRDRYIPVKQQQRWGVYDSIERTQVACDLTHEGAQKLKKLLQAWP